MHFKHEMIGKHFTETLNKMELQINRVRINRARPVSHISNDLSVYQKEDLEKLKKIGKMYQ